MAWKGFLAGMNGSRINQFLKSVYDVTKGKQTMITSDLNSKESKIIGKSHKTSRNSHLILHSGTVSKNKWRVVLLHQDSGQQGRRILSVWPSSNQFVPHQFLCSTADCMSRVDRMHFNKILTKHNFMNYKLYDRNLDMDHMYYVICICKI